MASDAPKTPLYDFLYRDSTRVASYYAQLFEGRLTSLEKSDANRHVVDKESAVKAAMASADIRSIQETTSGARFTYDPHEVITVDVINRLTDAGFINPGSPKFAPHGALVLAKGTLVFLDRSMVQLGVLAFDTLVSAEKTKPKSQQNANLIASLGFLKSLMNGISIPSAFLLATPDGVQIAGTIKELGMEEPISTYYFRHGTAGLSDVYLLGIKEIASTALSLPGKDLMAAGQQAAKALHEMLFPADAIRVTPILMYRKL